MNRLNAAVAAGYSENTARDGKNIHRLESLIKIDLENHLERAGLTDKAIANELSYYAFARENNSLDALKFASVLKGHVKVKTEHTERKVILIRNEQALLEERNARAWTWE